MRKASKMITVRVEPTLHALLPELSRLHSHKSIGEIIRRLLWTEADRLGLRVADQASRTKGRHRFTT